MESSEQPHAIGSALLLLACVIALGGGLLYLLGGGQWPLSDSFYVALNAVSTVGFREPRGMDDVPFARAGVALIIVAGLGAVTYFQSNLTAVLVQGVIGDKLRGKRMQQRINALRNHIIVAGAGSTGIHVVEELHATNTPFVVIDRDRARLDAVSADLSGGKLLYVIGDATDDATLMRAGIAHCRGVVAALTEDKDNLYVTLSARSLNASARIVTRVIAPDAEAKMMRAGANATVSPNMIGGRRLASEIVRPTVVQFIDQMLRDKADVLRLEEVTVTEGSWFVGQQLRNVPIRSETSLLVVAMRVGDSFVYNPEPSTELEIGSILVVLGTAANVARLRELVLRPASGSH